MAPLLLALLILTGAPAPASATATTSVADPGLVEAGFEAYNTTCAGCHQAGGVGIEGAFPPLIDNPRIADTAYVVDIIRNGKQGQLEVSGVVYNGVMPAFSALPEPEVDAIVAYLQAGFVTPVAAGEAETTLPLATGALPDLSGIAMLAAFVVVAAVGLFVMAPRIVAANDRLTLPWLDAWMRVSIIAIFFIAAIVVIPSVVMKSAAVSSLSRPLQDVIGLSLWGGGLGAGLWGLWYAHRENRI